MVVSIIIPTYNSVQLLWKTFYSILHQSCQPREVVISDDGSSEDIIAGIEDLIETAGFRIKFVRQEDNGFRAARCRNNGVRAAEGDFIVCFDQDLAFSKNYLQTLVETARPKRFVVGSVVRLSSEQSRQILPANIEAGDFSAVLTEKQKRLTLQQYRKEMFYALLHRLKLRPIGPKLRSGTVGFFKEDFIRVNGFDEKFEGWGNEDDDLGFRFHAAGIRGVNPFRHDYAVHFFHEKAHSGERVNRQYYKQRQKEINERNFRCAYGYDIYESQEQVTVDFVKP